MEDEKEETSSVPADDPGFDAAVDFSRVPTRLSDYDCELNPDFFEQEMNKKCSSYLVFATAASFTLFLTVFGLLFIEYRRGTIQEIYESSLKIPMIAFQFSTLLTTGAVCAYHAEKMLKRSFGFQKLENNHLAILISAFMTILLFILSGVLTIINMRFVLVIGALLVIDSMGSLLVCMTLYKQREKMQDFVEAVLHVNRAEGLPLSEQNALDLCEMQMGDEEFRQLANRRRYCAHVEGIRLAEYYYLQKWCAELERLKFQGAEGKTPQIDAILREMRDRAQIFGLDEREELRWRELAAYPHLVLPEEAAYFANEAAVYAPVQHTQRLIPNGNVYERQQISQFY